MCVCIYICTHFDEESHWWFIRNSPVQCLNTGGGKPLEKIECSVTMVTIYPFPQTKQAIITTMGMRTWARVKIHCWCLVRKYTVSLFWGALSLYSVLFKSTLHNAKTRRNWLHGFRSVGCWGGIQDDSGALRLCVCNHVGELSEQIPRLLTLSMVPKGYKITDSMKRKRFAIVPLCAAMASENATLPRAKNSRNWRWDLIVHHSSNKEALVAMKTCFRLPKSQNNLMENLFAFLLSSSCGDQMSLSLVRGSFLNKRLSW